MINVLTLIAVHVALGYLLWTVVRTPDPEVGDGRQPFLRPRAPGEAAGQPEDKAAGRPGRFGAGGGRPSPSGRFAPRARPDAQG